MDFSKYKFRCSALGNIISKSGKITQGVQTYLQEIFIEETTGIRKQVSSKYFDKGNLCEQNAMQILQEALYPNSFVRAFKTKLSNDFVQGTLDVDMPDYLYDIKNAYDRFTFGKAECTWDYEWQVKSYLWLKGKNKGRLFYTLCDMPEELIQEEERKLFYILRPKPLSFDSQDYLDACEELRRTLDFSQMQLHERFKIWDIELTEKDIEIMENSVKVAREYLAKLNEEQQFLHAKNLGLMLNARGQNKSWENYSFLM